jgi:hypothetical protein
MQTKTKIKLIINLILIAALVIIIPKVMNIYKDFSAMQKAVSLEQEALMDLVNKIKVEETSIKEFETKLNELQKKGASSEFGVLKEKYMQEITVYEAMVKEYNAKSEAFAKNSQAMQDKVNNFLAKFGVKQKK